MQNHHEVPLYFKEVAVILTLVIFDKCWKQKPIKNRKRHQRIDESFTKEAHLIQNKVEKIFQFL